MASIFKNPLVVLQNVVGMALDQRAVVLYEQPDDYTSPMERYEKEKSGQTLEDAKKYLKANILDTVGWFVQQNKLTELFTGIDVKYVSDINGFNAYGISYVKSEVDISSDIAEHPVEDGTVITDTSIINPITVKLSISMPTAFYTRIYQQIFKAYTDKTKIMMKTKFGMIRNLVISAMPFVLDVGTVDRPTIELELHQIIEVKASYTTATIGTTNNIEQGKSLEPSDSDTTDLGRITPDGGQ